MRKFLSILLAVLMVASVSVMSFSAADTEVQTATVTLKNIFGDTVTETYAVGDTITAYTYLNASEINDGKIASIHGKQFYSHDVLELVAEYTETDGITSDLTAMFPVTKTNTMASGHWTTSVEYKDMGAVYYNASIASLKGFPFNADDAALIVVNYKVKAAGNAEINNEMVTLASSDENLSGIVEDGVMVKNNFTMPIALSKPVIPVPVTGVTVSGAITSYLKTEFPTEVSTVTLTGTDNNFTSSVTGDTEYTFESVPAGTYTLSVAKQYHVTREYEITVGTDAVTQDVTINPLGDANQNGKVEARDAMRISQHTVAETDDQMLQGYAALCADVNGNSKIEARDGMRVFQQTQGEDTLYPTTD